MIEVEKVRPSGLFTNYIFKAIPLAFDESMSYYECLCGLLDYLKNTIIPAVNNNADAVIEVQNLITQLQNYVDNYFDNTFSEMLDAKLDELVENGTIANILENYANIERVFNTLDDALNDTNLVVGQKIKTTGYHAVGDNGESEYIITDTIPDTHYETINEGLYAKLINDKNTITPQQFGCYGDGTHNDTVNLQACINYAIANKKQIDLCGDYLVMPTLQPDNTKLCLYVYRDSSDNSHGSDSNITFNFIRQAKIFTTSTDDCTLMRFNICNINFENAFLKGVQDKTTLIELSKIDKLSEDEVQWSSYNIFRNCMLLACKTAIHMEGNSYYNTFDKCTIRYVTNGIELDMTAREKAGLSQDSSVNRNDFTNITVQNCTGKGVAVYYGDTNKFINLSFEGVYDCIYLDDPKKHTSDFLIEPLYHTNQNMFVNLVAEATTHNVIYNNSEGLKIINTSIPYQISKNNFVIPPLTYIGAGADESNSIEKSMDIYKTQEAVPFTGMQSWSTVINSSRGLTSRYYSDYSYSDSTYTTLSRRNLPFNESNITNLKSGTSLTYESSYKCITKQIGGIVFLSSKFKMQPNNLNGNIELPLDSSISADNQLYQYLTLPGMAMPVCVVSGTMQVVLSRIQGGKIVLYPPTGGWASEITVFLNIHYFRDTLPY